MEELFVFIGGLFCFALALAAVALVGHGLWLLGAAAVRAMSGSDADRPAIRGQTCPACGAPHGIIDGRCGYCGFQPHLAPHARRKRELETTARVFQEWRDEGDLNTEQYAQLQAILARQRAKLADTAPPRMAPAPPPEPTPASSPEPTPPPLAPQPDVEWLEPSAHEPQETTVMDAVVVDEPFAPAAAARSPQEVHPLDRDYSADATRPASPTFSDRARRRLADVLTAFMEEKNIRWGEIVAGLLIVGSAIGCVISLQETIRAADPYVPAFLFMLATAAIFGAGVYTLRRWDLQSVSRAVLIIALLLIPLNFLSATSPDEKRPVTDPMYVLAVVLGLGAFGAIAWRAGRILVGDAALRLTLGVVGVSACQLYLSRLASPTMGIGSATLLFSAPALAYLTAIVWQTWRVSQWKTLSKRRAEQTFIVTGVATFSLLVTIGLTAFRAGGAAALLERLSPALCVLGAAVVALGLAAAGRSVSSEQGPLRTAALVIALLGASLMTANLMFAWPEPGLLITVGAVSFVALTALAALFGQSALHGPAIACLSIAVLVGFHLMQQDGYDRELGRRLLPLLWMGRSAVILTGLGLVVAAAGAGLIRAGRQQDGRVYAAAGGVLVALSVLLALGVGFSGGPDSYWTTPLLAFYAVVLLAVAVTRAIPLAALLGGPLLLAALIHGAAMNQPLRAALANASLLPQRPVLAASLLGGLVCVGLAVATAVVGRRRTGEADAPSWIDLPDALQPGAIRASLPSGFACGARHTVAALTLVGLVVSLAAAPFALWTQREALPNVAYLAAVALIWLAAGWLHRLPGLVSAFGWAATTAVLYACVAFAQHQDWWNGSLLYPRHLQVQFAALAVWSLLWSGVRRAAGRSGRWRRLLDPPWLTADQAALAVVVLSMVGLAAIGCVPGVAAEMGVEAPSLTVGGAGLELIYDGAGWLVFVLVVAAVLGSLAERVSLDALLGLAVALAAAPLLAAPLAGEAATASACRWGFALYGIATAAAICARGPLGAVGRRLTWLRRDDLSEGGIEALRGVTFLLTLTPIIGLTFFAAARFLSGESLGGPADASIFGAFPPAVLYAGPMLVLVGVLAAYGVREGAEGYLLLGSILFQATITLACLLALAPLEDGRRLRVELLQWNAVALGAFSLLWLASLRWSSRFSVSWNTLKRELQHRKAEEPRLLRVQLTAALLAVVALGAWAAAGVFVRPAAPPAELYHLGGFLSYAALALAALATLWWLRREGREPAIHGVAVTATVLCALAAASTASLSSPQSWTSYYVLTGSWLAATALATLAAAGARAWRTRPVTSDAAEAGHSAPTRLDWLGDGAAAAWWARFLGAAVVVLACGASVSDPLRPWWSAAPAAATALCAAVLAVVCDRRSDSYAGAGLAVLAGVFIGMGPFIGLWRRDDLQAAVELLDAGILAAVLAAGVSLACMIRWGNRQEPRIFFAPPVHAFVSVTATGLLALMAWGGLFFAALERETGIGNNLYVGNALGAITAASLGALLLASLGDARVRYPLPCLYVWGGACMAMVLDQFGLDLQRAVFATAIAAAAYVMLTGLLWRSGIGLAKLGARLGVPDPVEGLRRVSTWLPGVNALQAFPWTFLAFWMVLGFEDRAMRFGAALVPLLLAVGIGSLAQQKRRGTMQQAALLLLTLAAVFLGWADIQPGGAAAVWLARCVRLLIVLSAAAAVYGGIVIRLLPADSIWRGSVRRATVGNGVAAMISLALVLLLEWSLFQPEVGVPGIEGPQIFAVAAVLVGLIAALISLALLPMRDPLSLSEEQRMWYVYTAEAIGALLFAHIYMTMPELFSGRLREYWAFIVVAIAYAGVGAGELFRRSGVRVLAEPLGRTGVFLPLLPALAFWAQASLTSYAGVLFWVGLLYVVLAIQHKSFKYGLAAGLAGNAALWALMQDQGLTILEHPQFWLIPPAISVLVASHLTRDQLKESQLTAIRYAAMIVIYLSSTGEMFIAGVGRSLWPVMALTAFSVLGVLAGIGLRVRAFLYLGAGFLTLSIVSMVWHASRALQHVWPWWAFGFALGVAILVLFALFEKRRDTFLQKIEKLQTWEM